MDLYIVTAGIKTEEKSGNLGIFFWLFPLSWLLVSFVHLNTTVLPFYSQASVRGDMVWTLIK
jgi:hypothetical protein